MSKASKLSKSFKSGHKPQEDAPGETTVDKIGDFFKSMFDSGTKKALTDSVTEARKKKDFNQDEYNKKYKIDDHRDKSIRRRH